MKTVEILVIAWTNIVMHLVQEFGQYHMFTVLLGKPNHLVHQNRSQDLTLIFGPSECSFDCVSLIFIFFIV